MLSVAYLADLVFVAYLANLGFLLQTYPHRLYYVALLATMRQVIGRAPLDGLLLSEGPLVVSLSESLANQGKGCCSKIIHDGGGCFLRKILRSFDLHQCRLTD